MKNTFCRTRRPKRNPFPFENDSHERIWNIGKIVVVHCRRRSFVLRILSRVKCSIVVKQFHWGIAPIKFYGNGSRFIPQQIHSQAQQILMMATHCQRHVDFIVCDDNKNWNRIRNGIFFPPFPFYINYYSLLQQS